MGSHGTGRQAIRWSAVTVLVAIACVCVLGPGRFLPLQLEGAVLVTLSPDHGVTVLDTVALGLCGLALALALDLLGGGRA